MGNHHAEEDLEYERLREQKRERERQGAWDAMLERQKIDILERRLAEINEMAVSLRDQIGFGDVFADLKARVHEIVERARDYRPSL